MMLNDETYREAFNVLCGDKLGEGIHRTVYTCKLRPDLVVKVENGDWRYFANVLEMKFWNDHEHYKKVADWLAPCDSLSPDGRVLLQKRVDPLGPGDRMPAKIPSFLTDLKRENFGRIGGSHRVLRLRNDDPQSEHSHEERKLGRLMTEETTRTDLTVPQNEVHRLPSISADSYQHVGRYAGALVLSCFEQMGGLPRMVNWADTNPTDFYTKLFPKMIARSAQVDVSGTLTLDDAITRLESGAGISEADYEEITEDLPYDL